ncbi:chemotaxis protein CheW [Silvimonas amylolytica]|uniref:Chemotaxis protein CheW n=1 Tax=Silvimonas amylolytica TaxID=449663 RepID=A0ABQ2PP71_9NEIS|nr:chemotaxis protein CheW [Silvimonas amylolytica]GGP27176.1 chemotaxis protein CheW [Silvimonas amylolytica]
MTSSIAPVAHGAGPALSQQFLTFSLASELFAIPIDHIREIIEFGGLTEIPLMPVFLRGVINLRGAVVPVVDLAARFGRAATVVGRRTCVVILEVEQDEHVLPLGVLVDAVNEVITVEADQIEPTPEFGARLRAEFILGMLRLSERFVIALDIQKVLSVEEMTQLAATEALSPEDAAVLAVTDQGF